MIEGLPTYDLPHDNEALSKLLAKFTYKPGWTFVIERGNLVIRAMTVDTDDHRRLIPINFGVGIPSFVCTEFSWERWLLGQIIEVERHEAQEFFKINGVKVFDPHA